MCFKHVHSKEIQCAMQIRIEKLNPSIKCGIMWFNLRFFEDHASKVWRILAYLECNVNENVCWMRTHFER